MSKKRSKKYSSSEQKAYSFGKGYAAGRAGTFVPYSGKNQESFKNGVKAGEKLIPRYEQALKKRDN